MKDFILLFQAPSELYKKGRKNVSIMIPLIIYFILGILSIAALYFGVESGPTVDILRATPGALPITMASGILGVVLGLVIAVQILYYAMVLCCKMMDDVEFEKKLVKKLIYLAEILPAIPITLLQIIFMFVIKIEIPTMLGTICSIISSLLTCLMIYYTMKVSMGTKKAHLYYPAFVFAVMVLIQVISLITANNTLANLSV